MNPSGEKAKAPEKTKALCVATRCTSIEQFVATFHRFCDESSFFVATLATRPVGLETAFSIQLEDKTPVLRGLCVVVEAWSTPANRFGRPGVRLNVRRLTNESLPVFKQLQAARMAAEAAEKAKADESTPVTKVADAKRVDTKAADAKRVDTKAADAKPVVTKDADAKPAVEAKPLEAKPVVDVKPAGIAAKAPEKPKTLSEKLAEIRSQPKPPAIPPRKTDGVSLPSSVPPLPSSVPAIPSTLPKITPTAFAVKPAPTPGAKPIIVEVEVEIDEPTKIEAKTVRAEGTAPVARAEVEAPSARSVTSAMAAPIDAPSRPTPPPRAANVTTPAIGISTSTINLSNAALTAEDTHAQASSYDTASIVDAPPLLDPVLDPVLDPASKPEAEAKAIVATNSDAPALAATNSDAPALVATNSDAPEAIAAIDDMTSPVASEARAPGSSFVLPANPLMNLSDKSLEGFVDCALYEETGNFFRAPGYEDSLVDIDEVAGPPGVLSPTPAIRPGDEVSQAAYVITPTPSYAQQSFTQPEMPVSGRNPTQPPYPTGPIVPVQLPTGQIVPMQYPTGQMAPLQYPTGQMAPLQYPMQNGTTNPPYGAPNDATAAMLASHGASRRRWMIIGGAAVIGSLLLLVIVLAMRGDDKTATAATATTTSTPPATPTEKPPSDEKVTMAVTAPVETAAPEPKVTATPEPDENASVGDPNSPPVVGQGPCKLTVTTTPAGSIVRLDDQVMGPSPITIQSECARKRVDVKHPRYAPGTKWVSLAADTPASVDIPLSRPTHKVTIISQPAGATVSIAGRRAGTTPTAVQMMGFTKVALTIEKKGYKTVVESIYSKSDGERRTVTLTKSR